MPLIWRTQLRHQDDILKNPLTEVLPLQLIPLFAASIFTFYMCGRSLNLKTAFLQLKASYCNNGETPKRWSGASQTIADPAAVLGGGLHLSALQTLSKAVGEIFAGRSVSARMRKSLKTGEAHPGHPCPPERANLGIYRKPS